LLFTWPTTYVVQSLANVGKFGVVVLFVRYYEWRIGLEISYRHEG